MGNDVVNDVMRNEGIQELLMSNEKFDVCVLEVFNVNAFVVGRENKYYFYQIYKRLLTIRDLLIISDAF